MEKLSRSVRYVKRALYEVGIGPRLTSRALPIASSGREVATWNNRFEPDYQSGKLTRGPAKHETQADVSVWVTPIKNFLVAEVHEHSAHGSNRTKRCQVFSHMTFTLGAATRLCGFSPEAIDCVTCNMDKKDESPEATSALHCKWRSKKGLWRTCNFLHFLKIQLSFFIHLYSLSLQPKEDEKKKINFHLTMIFSIIQFF